MQPGQRELSHTVQLSLKFIGFAHVKLRIGNRFERRFQRQFSLSADGILGKDTWNKIVSVHNAMQAGNPTHVTTQYPGVPLRVGSTGDYVRFVQSYLNGISGRPLLTVDGNYGQNTTRAVGLFQATAGLPVDGVVGSATWAALIPAFNATL